MPPLIPVLYPSPTKVTVAIPASGGKSVPETVEVLEEGLGGLPALLKQKGWEGRDIDIALPNGDVLLIALRLPTRDLQEIDAMVELQSEEFTPFPPERTCRGWEVVGEHDTGLRVRLVLASTSRLQELRQAARDVGLRVRRVDVDVLGCLHLLKQTSPLQDGAGLLIRDGVGDLMVWNDGQLERLQHLGDVTSSTLEEVAEDIEMVMMGVETGSQTPLQIWVQGSPPDWASSPAAGMDWEMQQVDDGILAARGVMQRLADEVTFDLAPPEWEKEHQSVLNRRTLVRKVGSLAAVWLLLLAGMLAWGYMQETDVRDLELQVANRTGIVEEVGQMGAQVRSLAAFVDRSSSALEVFWWMSRSIPGEGGDLQVRELRFDKEEGVRFSGSSRGSETNLLEFMDGLSRKDELNVSYSLDSDSQGRSTFQVTALWSWVRSEGDPM